LDVDNSAGALVEPTDSKRSELVLASFGFII
jgi:hypothetical protein